LIGKDGWYRVKIKNNSPDEGEALYYDEWVEFIDGHWDLSGMGNVSVARVIKAESNG
tara:strand:- start:306 stop:476 length:171 start_codon:yes stop_codon:yes gene_type:complete